MMGKPTTILDFFKTKNAQSLEANIGDASSSTSDITISSAYFFVNVTWILILFFIF
jgi:hypothetical protein